MKLACEEISKTSILLIVFINNLRFLEKVTILKTLPYLENIYNKRSKIILGLR